VFLTHAMLDGRYAIRLALGHSGTTQGAVDEAWELLVGESRTTGKP
jgi:hypothetical protein